MIKDLVEHVIKQLVAVPEAVDVHVTRRDDAHVVEIRIDQSDRGRVIGKEGQTIKSLRALLTIAVADGEKVVLEII